VGFLAYSCDKIQILQQFKYLEAAQAIPKIVDTVMCTKVIWSAGGPGHRRQTNSMEPAIFSN
jgi:hypothetical protein